MKISSSEWKRKAVHAGMGLFALALRWLTWEQAALCALAALLFNLFVIPRFGRGLYRAASGHRDAGIVAYPAVVLVLILICRGQYLPMAAAVWAMMAFGDPAASIFGTAFGGPVLPWNAGKTWIGLFANWAFGGVGSVLVFAFAARGVAPLAVAILMAGAGLFAFLESVRSGIDDNLVPALPTLFFLAWVSLANPPFAVPGKPPLWLAVLVNAGVAAAAHRARAVSFSGAVGGAAVGTAILAAGGGGAYAVLWSFFLAGTVASRWGYREKAKRGTAQAREGRRGAEHVAANCLVAALIALLSPFQARWGLAFAACFAAALADTLGTEFESLYERRAFSPLGFRALPPGTPGAISWPGTAASLAGASVVAAAGWALGLVPAALVLAAAFGGFFGALAESVVNDFGRRNGFSLDHEFANALNTFIGAMLALRFGRA